jgi:hypothetical protein
MEGYYQYLPVFFLQDWDNFRTLPWAKPYGEGRTLSVFTCGTAILQAPFFLAAHIITLATGMPATGYGTIYYFFIFLAGLFYASMGLLFLARSLTWYVPSKTAFMTTVLIFYGTNLFYYTIMGPGMSHLYSFFLISYFIYRVPFFYEKISLRTLLPVALPFALAVLVRPTNAVIFLYFLLFEAGTLKEMYIRILLLFRKWYLMVIWLLVLLLVFAPQMMYWHFVTGKWMIYSYQEEGFTFLKNPQVLTVLFGKRGGWFVYTPIMFIAGLTLIWMLRKKLFSSPAIFLTMLVIIYLNSSWWAPTFSACAGYRALVEFLPFMAFPLAYFYQNTVSGENRLLRRIFVVVFWIFVLYNIQFAFKYDSTVWWDREWSIHTLMRLLTF